ncbi:hypothetical protein CYMTET_43801 [Cymbomonas tetramitiformis]|uniref:C3H1-type domain-containing protein n=1 Tax=Cymbomonas tetramitiformis TaxID=36881 RepID=A0AAE0C2Q2_9CHLO|nr:hypothetical protein CYMTET_43801 [Cymbomonas tetramitiformis]
MNTLGISGSLGTALQKIGNSQGSLANSELFIALENSEESNPSYEAAESQAAFQTDEEEQIVSLLSQNLHSTLQLPSPFRVLTSELEQRQRQFTSGNFQDANDARDCLFRLQYLQQELARWAFTTTSGLVARDGRAASIPRCYNVRCSKPGKGVAPPLLRPRKLSFSIGFTRWKAASYAVYRTHGVSPRIRQQLSHLCAQAQHCINKLGEQLHRHMWPSCPDGQWPLCSHVQALSLPPQHTATLAAEVSGSPMVAVGSPPSLSSSRPGARLKMPQSAAAYECHPIQAQAVCCYFARGQCRYADKCRFRHEILLLSQLARKGCSYGSECKYHQPNLPEPWYNHRGKS